MANGLTRSATLSMKTRKQREQSSSEQTKRHHGEPLASTAHNQRCVVPAAELDRIERAMMREHSDTMPQPYELSSAQWYNVPYRSSAATIYEILRNVTMKSHFRSTKSQKWTSKIRYGKSPELLAGSRILAGLKLDT